MRTSMMACQRCGAGSASLLVRSSHRMVCSEMQCAWRATCARTTCSMHCQGQCWGATCLPLQLYASPRCVLALCIDTGIPALATAGLCKLPAQLPAGASTSHPTAGSPAAATPLQPDEEEFEGEEDVKEFKGWQVLDRWVVGAEVGGPAWHDRVEQVVSDAGGCCW